MGVAQQRLLPATEGVVGHGHRNRHVDAHHASLNLNHKVAGGVAVGGEDGRAVTVRRRVNDLDSLFVGVGVYHYQHRAENFLAVDVQLAVHVVQNGRAQPETVSVLFTLGLVAATVEHHAGAISFSFIDPLGDALLARAGDNRAHFAGRVSAGANHNLFGASLDGRNQLLRNAAHSHDYRQGHAALTGSPEGTGADVLSSKLDVGVGHDNGVVVSATQSLHALTVSHTGVLHNVSHRGGTHKADGVNARVGEDVAHQVAVTSNYVEQTVRQAGLLVEASYEVRGAGNRGGYLEDEGVTGGQGYRVHPQWHHGREVEGANASDDADRLTHSVYVYTTRGLVSEFTLESSVNAAHKVHGFATTGNLTQGVTVSLAAFAHDNVG